MRVSGWLLGLIGLGALFVAAGFCSLTAFGLTRQLVVDMQQTGTLLDDPLAMLRCVAGGECTTPEPNLTPAPPPVLALTPLLTAAPALNRPTASPVIPTARATDSSPIQQVQATALPDSSQPRITDPRQIWILLMGIDQRSATSERGPFRTDTMMLMNVDPARKRVAVLSFPRDLWVNIPDFEPGRINTANRIGDASNYPGGGGPALAMETIASNFGVPVDKYLRINFDVFLTLVDMLAPNGATVDVREWIDDPDYPDDRYGTIHVQFAPGTQRMDAETLLQYARTRATQGGDFDRAQRQQQVLDALRAEVLSAGGIINFIAQAPQLWTELAGNYRTNLSYDELIALGFLMGEIDPDDIHYEVIDNLYVSSGISPQGDQVLYPDYAGISDLIQHLFFPLQLSPGEIKQRADEEAAAIYVFNGTLLVGLASATSDWLTAQGITVTGIDNDIITDRAETEIRDYGGQHTWTTLHLAQVMGLPESRIRRSGDGLIAEGVMVALGTDAVLILEG